MLPSPLPGREKLRVNVRPIKYAYFLREDDTESLKRILRLVCTQWGGIRSLIVPLGPTFAIDRWFREFMSFHAPDRFVFYGRSGTDNFVEASDELHRQLHELWPHRLIQVQAGPLFEEHDPTAHVLSTISDQDLERQPLTVYRFGEDDRQALLYLLLFGEMPENQIDEYESLMKAGLIYKDATTSGRAFWEAQADSSAFGSVLNLTGYGISPYRVDRGFESNRFEFILLDSSFSLFSYWNYRATIEAITTRREMGRRLLILPESVLDDTSEMDELIRFVRERLPHPVISSNLHLTFGATPEGRERLASTLARIPGLEPLADNQVRIQISPRPGQPPATEDFTDRSLSYLLVAPALPTYFLEGVDHGVPLTVDVSPGRNEVLYMPPATFRNRYYGSVALDLESELRDRYPESYLVSQAVKSESWFSRYGITYTASILDQTHYVEFDLVDPWRALSLFFTQRGFEIRPSRISTYLEAFVDLIGGLDQIGSIANKMAYDVLDRLAVKSTKKLAQRLAREGRASIDGNSLSLSGLEILPVLRQEPRSASELAGSVGVPKRELLALLSRLSAQKVLKRGFYLECDRCGTPSWYPLDTAQEDLTCPGCAARFHLPVEHPPGSGAEIQWSYTLNSLADRVMDQDGLPPLLALYHLTRSVAAYAIIPGLELLKNGQVHSEFDFAFVTGKHVMAGECKAGVKLEEKDLESARTAFSLGVNRFYFCTLRAFDDGTQDMLNILKSELVSEESGFGIEILEGTSLLGTGGVPK